MIQAAENIKEEYSPHEQWVINQGEVQILSADKGAGRARVNRILKRVHLAMPRMSVDRARYFVESMRATQGMPLTLRWAKAMANIMDKINVYILPDELVVGRAGPEGRYGIMYPELDGGFFTKPAFLEQDSKTLTQYTEESLKIIREEIAPYCTGTAFREVLAGILPEDVRQMIFKDNDPYKATMLILESATLRSSLQWNLDYKKVLEHGFEAIWKQAKEAIAALDTTNFERLPFYQGVIILCEAIKRFSERHAALACKMAEKEQDATRKQELLTIADICSRVPWKAARNFHEAIQAQWFTQLVSRFEQMVGGVIGNNRIDQYLYPFYKKDVAEGRLDDEKALELLECLWLNMAQCVLLFGTPTARAKSEGNAHFEHTTIGGVHTDGTDASNELTHLILKSKREFPLDFPDLSVRIHATTPDKLLMAVCDTIKQGTGFPKLFNDEEIIPALVAKGATLAEARDYCGSGCTEVRLVNKNTYMTGTTWFNLASAVEMALYNGKCFATGESLSGLETGDAILFKTYEEFEEAFKAQLRHIIIQAIKQLRLTESLRPNVLAAPYCSALHDLCMKYGKDITECRIPEALMWGPQLGPIGFGTAIDSLAAIKYLVFKEKSVSMEQMLKALKANFEGYEDIRQRCLNAPKFGNLIKDVDDIGRMVDDTMLEVIEKHGESYYGGKAEMFHVPVTTHIAMGRAAGATPNGRRAGEYLSEGISPSQGADVLGPTATLQSIRNTKATPFTRRAARLLNLKILPQTVAGEDGSRKLASFIRSWCDQKHWHIQFSIVNSTTLVEAKKNPEKYKNLIVRVAGYSAYFVDLSESLQNELVNRTEHATF